MCASNAAIRFLPPPSSRGSAGAAPPGLARVFYADNGSAGVEVALKMAFHWFRNRGEMKRTKFIALENGYHGETIGALAVGKIENKGRQNRRIIVAFELFAVV